MSRQCDDTEAIRVSSSSNSLFLLASNGNNTEANKSKTQELKKRITTTNGQEPKLADSNSTKMNNPAASNHEAELVVRQQPELLEVNSKQNHETPAAASKSSTSQQVASKLRSAANEGKVDLVRLLLRCGANVNAQDDEFGNTALHQAAWNGFSETIQVLCKHRANTSIKNKAQFSPLHLACQQGHNQSARLLLMANAKSEAKNSYGDTPLHTAARYGHAGVARILLSAKANVNQLNKQDETAMDIALRKDLIDIQELIANPPAKRPSNGSQRDHRPTGRRRVSRANVVEIEHNRPRKRSALIDCCHHDHGQTQIDSSNEDNNRRQAKNGRPPISQQPADLINRSSTGGKHHQCCCPDDLEPAARDNHRQYAHLTSQHSCSHAQQHKRHHRTSNKKNTCSTSSCDGDRVEDLDVLVCGDSKPKLRNFKSQFELNDRGRRMHNDDTGDHKLIGQFSSEHALNLNLLAGGGDIQKYERPGGRHLSGSRTKTLISGVNLEELCRHAANDRHQSSSINLKPRPSSAASFSSANRLRSIGRQGPIETNKLWPETTTTAADQQPDEREEEADASGACAPDELHNNEQFRSSLDRLDRRDSGPAENDSTVITKPKPNVTANSRQQQQQRREKRSSPNGSLRSVSVVSKSRGRLVVVRQQHFAANSKRRAAAASRRPNLGTCVGKLSLLQLRNIVSRRREQLLAERSSNNNNNNDDDDEAQLDGDSSQAVDFSDQQQQPTGSQQATAVVSGRRQQRQLTAEQQQQQSPADNLAPNGSKLLNTRPLAPLEDDSQLYAIPRKVQKSKQQQQVANGNADKRPAQEQANNERVGNNDDSRSQLEPNSIIVSQKAPPSGRFLKKINDQDQRHLEVADALQSTRTVERSGSNGPALTSDGGEDGDSTGSGDARKALNLRAQGHHLMARFNSRRQPEAKSANDDSTSSPIASSSDDCIDLIVRQQQQQYANNLVGVHHRATTAGQFDDDDCDLLAPGYSVVVEPRDQRPASSLAAAGGEQQATAATKQQQADEQQRQESATTVRLRQLLEVNQQGGAESANVEQQKKNNDPKENKSQQSASDEKNQAKKNKNSSSSFWSKSSKLFTNQKIASDKLLASPASNGIVQSKSDTTAAAAREQKDSKQDSQSEAALVADLASQQDELIKPKSITSGQSAELIAAQKSLALAAAAKVHRNRLTAAWQLGRVTDTRASLDGDDGYADDDDEIDACDQQPQQQLQDNKRKPANCSLLTVKTSAPALDLDDGQPFWMSHRDHRNLVAARLIMATDGNQKLASVRPTLPETLMMNKFATGLQVNHGQQQAQQLQLRNGTNSVGMSDSSPSNNGAESDNSIQTTSGSSMNTDNTSSNNNTAGQQIVPTKEQNISTTTTSCESKLGILTRILLNNKRLGSAANKLNNKEASKSVGGQDQAGLTIRPQFEEQLHLKQNNKLDNCSPSISISTCSSSMSSGGLMNVGHHQKPIKQQNGKQLDQLLEKSRSRQPIVLTRSNELESPDEKDDQSPVLFPIRNSMDAQPTVTPRLPPKGVLKRPTGWQQQQQLQPTSHLTVVEPSALTNGLPRVASYNQLQVVDQHHPTNNNSNLTPLQQQQQLCNYHALNRSHLIQAQYSAYLPYSLGRYSIHENCDPATSTPRHSMNGSDQFARPPSSQLSQPRSVSSIGAPMYQQQQQHFDEHQLLASSAAVNYEYYLNGDGGKHYANNNGQQFLATNGNGYQAEPSQTSSGPSNHHLHLEQQQHHHHHSRQHDQSQQNLSTLSMYPNYSQDDSIYIPYFAHEQQQQPNEIPIKGAGHSATNYTTGGKHDGQQFYSTSSAAAASFRPNHDQRPVRPKSSLDTFLLRTTTMTTDEDAEEEAYGTNTSNSNQKSSPSTGILYGQTRRPSATSLSNDQTTPRHQQQQQRDAAHIQCNELFHNQQRPPRQTHYGNTNNIHLANGSEPSIFSVDGGRAAEQMITRNSIYAASNQLHKPSELIVLPTTAAGDIREEEEAENQGAAAMNDENRPTQRRPVMMKHKSLVQINNTNGRQSASPIKSDSPINGNVRKFTRISINQHQPNGNDQTATTKLVDNKANNNNQLRLKRNDGSHESSIIDRKLNEICNNFSSRRDEEEPREQEDDDEEFQGATVL